MTIKPPVLASGFKFAAIVGGHDLYPKLPLRRCQLEAPLGSPPPRATIIKESNR